LACSITFEYMELVRRHVEGKANLANQIFRWIMTELWFQRLIDAPNPLQDGGKNGKREGAATPA